MRKMNLSWERTVKFLQEFHLMIVRLPTNLYHHLKNEWNAFKRKYFKKNKAGTG